MRNGAKSQSVPAIMPKPTAALKAASAVQIANGATQTPQ